MSCGWVAPEYAFNTRRARPPSPPRTRGQAPGPWAPGPPGPRAHHSQHSQCRLLLRTVETSVWKVCLCRARASCSRVTTSFSSPRVRSGPCILCIRARVPSEGLPAYFSTSPFVCRTGARTGACSLSGQSTLQSTAPPRAKRAAERGGAGRLEFGIHC